MTTLGALLILLAIIGALTEREQPAVESYKPTRRQRREWRRQRYDLNPAMRRVR